MKFQNSIAKQLLIWIMLSSSVLTLIITSIHLFVDYNHDMSALDERLIQIETSYLPAIANALWVEDDEQINIQINKHINKHTYYRTNLSRSSRLPPPKNPMRYLF